MMIAPDFMEMYPHHWVGDRLVSNRSTTEIAPIRPATSVVGFGPHLEVLSICLGCCWMRTADNVVGTIQIGIAGQVTDGAV